MVFLDLIFSAKVLGFTSAEPVRGFTIPHPSSFLSPSTCPNVFRLDLDYRVQLFHVSAFWYRRLEAILANSRRSRALNRVSICKQVESHLRFKTTTSTLIQLRGFGPPGTPAACMIHAEHAPSKNKSQHQCRLPSSRVVCMRLHFHREKVSAFPLFCCF